MIESPFTKRRDEEILKIIQGQVALMEICRDLGIKNLED